MGKLLLSCGKNYKNCQKQLFSVLGILFLSLLLGSSATVTLVKSTVAEFKTSVSTHYQEADFSFSYLSDAVEKRAGEFDLEDVFDIIEAKSLMPLFEGEIKNSLKLIASNYQSFAENIAEDVKLCAAGLVVSVAAFALVLVLGMLISFLSADITVRSRAGEGGFFQIFKEMLLRLLGFLLATALVLGLYNLFSEQWKIWLVLYPFLIVLAALPAAWLAFRKRLSFKEVMTASNYFGLLIADLMMLTLSALIGWILFAVFNAVIAVTVTIALVIVTLVALDLSTTGCIAALLAGKAETEAIPTSEAVQAAGSAETAEEITAAETAAGKSAKEIPQD